MPRQSFMPGAIQIMSVESGLNQPITQPPLGLNPASFFLQYGRYYSAYKHGRYLSPSDEVLTLFPCDEDEKDRLDVFHKIFSVAFQERLVKYPLPTNAHVLDLGTGTGIWAIELADTLDYDNSRVIGVDISMIQPASIPPNLRFEHMDIEDLPWERRDPGTWDLIHMRTLLGGISSGGWPALYAEIYRHLRPGSGRIEQVEIDWTPRCDDGTLAANSALREWANEVMAAMDTFDRPMRIDSNSTRRQMEAAGLTNFEEEAVRLPLNNLWPEARDERSVARWFQLGFGRGLHPLTMAPLCRSGRKSPPQVMNLLERVRAEVSSEHIHAYCLLYVWTAQKEI